MAWQIRVEPEFGAGGIANTRAFNLDDIRAKPCEKLVQDGPDWTSIKSTISRP